VWTVSSTKFWSDASLRVLDPNEVVFLDGRVADDPDVEHAPPAAELVQPELRDIAGLGGAADLVEVQAEPPRLPRMSGDERV
jgi:rhodanese-related sulfurtransferase